MPNAAPKPCRKCGALTVNAGGYCDDHKQERHKRYDSGRGSSTQRGYCSRWQRARLVYLAANPLCVKCNDAGVIKVAEVVDHIQPHKGDSGLMWSMSNWQSLCKSCHDSKTATSDGGFGRA